MSYLPTYFRKSRSLALSLLAVLPLMLAYEFTIRQYHKTGAVEIRNSAEMIIKEMLSVVGLGHPIVQVAALTAIFLAVIIWAFRRGERIPPPAFFGLVIIESLIYAAVFGTVTRVITDFLLSLSNDNGLLSHDFTPQVLLSVAAGIYEELLFRLMMLGSLLILFKQLMQTGTWVQVAFATVISAVIFSIFHYPSWEYFAWQSFTFRFVAGIILGYLFIMRGFAVAVYTHAFYDILFQLRFYQ